MKRESFYNLPKPDEASNVTVHIFRHGPALYKIDAWRDVATADDLNTLGQRFDAANEEERLRGKEEAVMKVRQQADGIAKTIGPDEEVILWASPTARTLETARIIRDVFEEHELRVRRKGLSEEEGVRAFDVLGEVRHFNHDYYMSLVHGGTVTIDDQTITIDPKTTNPNNLSETKYFVSESLHDIPDTVKNSWPQPLRQFSEDMERHSSASKRIWNTLNRLRTLSDKKYRIIIVTHAGPADILVRSYAPDTQQIIEPADFVTVECRGDDMVITRPGSLADTK